MIQILRRGPTLSVLVAIAAVCLSGPVLELGLNDDWSFAFITRVLATTGRMTYNGWAAPLLGLQALWGAALIRVFGFSFTLLRLSTLPFAAGCAGMLYGLGRQSGLNHRMATFGAMAISLSPVFIPLAASFMTDLSALFFWLACFYCGMRALAGDRTAMWLGLATAAGFAGGTIRQIVWVAPVLVLPTVAWFRRKHWRIAAALWCALGMAAVACLAWYQAKPGHEPVPHRPWLAVLGELGAPPRWLLLGAIVALLPVTLAALAGWKRWRIALAGTLAAAAFLGACQWIFHDGLLLGNMVTPTGMLWEGSELLGDRPFALPGWILAAVAVTASLGVGGTLALLCDAWQRRGASPWMASPAFRMLALTVPSCAVYIAAVSFRCAVDGILFDRYLLFLTPPVVILVLLACQRQIGESPSALAWVVVAVLAAYGVASTHDYIAAARARLEAADLLRSTGIPRTQISAGLEYDGWTQLELRGRIPTLAERDGDARAYPLADPYWFWSATPAIDPRYIVVYSPVEGLLATRFAPVFYTAWLPPFHRKLAIERMR